MPAGTKTTWRAYIDDIAVISQTTNEGATIRYTHRDRLGSARVFTDHNGQVEAERNFDPFGKPRLVSGGLKPFGASKLSDVADAKTRRGFTDHEHLDSVELIHMNGRVYDYNLGRFMSVDPVIQSPTNSQSINPYSYIMNNPLSGTDPTGYTSCDADNPENCQEVAEELGKDKKADITQRQSVTGSRIKRDVKVGTMTGNGNGTVNVQIGNMSATADIGAPASNNKGANSTSGKLKSGTTDGAGNSSDGSSGVSSTKEWSQISKLMKSKSGKDRQLAIDMAIELGGIDVSQVSGKVTYRGGDNETTPDGEVSIGTGAFMSNKYFRASPGWLMSTIAHETEVHVNLQARKNRWWADADGTAMQEVQAYYQHEINNTARFGLSSKEVNILIRRRDKHMDNIYHYRNVDRVKQGDFSSHTVY
ncbi:RHS repeat-associated core domain-containing protein [Pseudoalteromonas sp.]|uniref:RHS repeat domain-containing protein n=1 Tax=Pseudoalteromonas sp. TaxID=53249 RepID=UPI00262A15FB|nr:RHS repeat-associated core domain-containing protein [Pseudoalteromonas sp.]